MIPKSGCFFFSKAENFNVFYLTRASNFHGFSIEIPENHVFATLVIKILVFPRFVEKIHVSRNPGFKTSASIEMKMEMVNVTERFNRGRRTCFH